MVIAIAFAFASGSFGDEASSIWALAWGKVTLVDLYAGLAIFGAWIAVREPRRGIVALWWIALVTLGFLAAGVYLIVALRNSNSTDEVLTGRRRREPHSAS